MLKLTNVTKVFEMGDYSVRALRGVTLAFRESEFVSVIGASGCGKSTLAWTGIRRATLSSAIPPQRTLSPNNGTHTETPR